MSYFPLSVFCWPLLVAASLLSRCAPASPETPPPPLVAAGASVEPVPATPAGPDDFAAPPLALQYEPGDVLTAIQERIVLPFGTPVPADTSRVVVQLVVGTLGEVSDPEIVRGISPAVDEAVLTALRDDLKFRPVQRDGKYLRQPYTLTIPAPGASTPAQRREATTRWQRTAVRLPGEADTTFVHRVLPLSYPWYEPNALQSLAWRPSPYGRQLVFTKEVIDPNVSYTSYGWRDTEVFVLDPYRPHTYAVQRFHLENIGDLPDQSAVPFMADVNADGRPDLVTLVTYSQSVSGGEGQAPGHMHYYRVEVWHTAGLDAAGRPRYRPDATPYPYLEYRQDETPGPYPEEFTPATVRRALARHHNAAKK